MFLSCERKWVITSTADLPLFSSFIHTDLLLLYIYLTCQLTLWEQVHSYRSELMCCLAADTVLLPNQWLCKTVEWYMCVWCFAAAAACYIKQTIDTLLLWKTSQVNDEATLRNKKPVWCIPFACSPMAVQEWRLSSKRMAFIVCMSRVVTCFVRNSWISQLHYLIEFCKLIQQSKDLKRRWFSITWHCMYQVLLRP